MRTLAEFVGMVKNIWDKSDQGKSSPTEAVAIHIDKPLTEELENMLAKQSALLAAVRNVVDVRSPHTLEDTITRINQLREAALQLGELSNVISLIKARTLREAAERVKPIPIHMTDLNAVRSALIQEAVRYEEEARK